MVIRWPYEPFLAPAPNVANVLKLCVLATFELPSAVDVPGLLLLVAQFSGAAVVNWVKRLFRANFLVIRLMVDWACGV